MSVCCLFQVVVAVGLTKQLLELRVSDELIQLGVQENDDAAVMFLGVHGVIGNDAPGELFWPELLEGMKVAEVGTVVVSAPGTVRQLVSAVPQWQVL